jgi:hypothetical protein
MSEEKDNCGADIGAKKCWCQVRKWGTMEGILVEGLRRGATPVVNTRSTCIEHSGLRRLRPHYHPKPCRDGCPWAWTQRKQREGYVSACSGQNTQNCGKNVDSSNSNVFSPALQVTSPKCRRRQGHTPWGCRGAPPASSGSQSFPQACVLPAAPPSSHDV